ncbi:hypothetical protein [Mesorhizobium sp. M1312]
MALIRTSIIWPADHPLEIKTRGTELKPANRRPIFPPISRQSSAT